MWRVCAWCGFDRKRLVGELGMPKVVVRCFCAYESSEGHWVGGLAGGRDTVVCIFVNVLLARVLAKRFSSLKPSGGGYVFLVIARSES